MKERRVSIIREVQVTDYEALARFFEENNRPEITKYFHPFPLTARTAYQIACRSHKDRYYIALWNRHIVGFCMLRGWEEGFEVPSFGVLVHYKHQGLGLGRQLTEFAIARARKFGCHSIRLSVHASNIRAVSLYTSLGFREISREPIVIGEQLDEKIIMIKKLSDERDV